MDVLLLRYLTPYCKIYINLNFISSKVNVLIKSDVRNALMDNINNMNKIFKINTSWGFHPIDTNDVIESIVLRTLELIKDKNF